MTMRRRSIARQLLSLTIFVALFCVDGQVARAQTQPPTLPANWQQLSPTDFASLIRQYVEQETFKSLSEADQEDLRSHGADLFSKVDISNTALNYQTLEMLHWVGRSELDQSVLEQAKYAVLARHDDWTGKPYAEIRAKVVMMLNMRVPDPALVTEARRWVLAGGTRAQVPQKDLSYNIVRQAFADVKVIHGSFTVDWVGQLNAPQSGDYTFFISPIDVNAGFHERPLNFSMKVSLAGQEIITATPPTPLDPLSATYRRGAPPKPNWVSQSNAVPLTAGTPVTLRVSVSVAASQGIPAGVLHGMLFWQGPSIAKSLVPTTALSQADTGAAGLKATYTWTAKGQQQSLTRVEPLIDCSWTNSSIILAQDTTIADQAADTMWQAMVSPDFIASYTGATPTVKLHPFLRDPDDVSSGISTGRRQAFLDLLLQTPALLDAMDAKHAVRFYEAFRVGTPDKALDVFGTWAARKADLQCDFSADAMFDGDTRCSLATMAILVTQQLPSEATRLQNQYLVLPDGRCSLPVAYTLAYSHLGLKNAQGWFALLDAKLADPALVGDLRVNWLLARAFATEIPDRAWRHYPFFYGIPGQDALRSRPLLDQASQVATAPATKVRVARELAGRFASAQLFQAAKAALQQIMNSLPTDQQAVVATLQQQLDGFVAARAKAIRDAPAAANQAYLQTLKARRQAATSRGDADGASRYDALINAATKQSPTP
jgi:hypothetical protein